MSLLESIGRLEEPSATEEDIGNFYFVSTADGWQEDNAVAQNVSHLTKPGK
jgi:hypothetical protein